MWTFDIDGTITSEKMCRKIRIREGYRREYPHEFFYLTESWGTLESPGSTGDWRHYYFTSMQDANFFIAELALKLNTATQNRLLQTADKFIADMTTQFKTPYPKRKKKKRQQNTAEDALRDWHDEYEKKHPNMSHVYIFDMNNGTCKIGVSDNVYHRRQTIMGHSGTYINRYCFTEGIPSGRAYSIEKQCHAYFDKQHTLYEFFKVSFDEAKAHLETYATVIEPKGVTT